MLELHTTTANTFAISQTVSEVVTNTLVNEGLSLLKVESGGLNNDTQIYYFSNNIGHLLPYKPSETPNFNVKLVFLRRETMDIDERANGQELVIFGIEHFVVSQTYTDNKSATTSFLDTLYGQLHHEVLAEFFIYKNTIYLSQDALIEDYLANNQK